MEIISCPHCRVHVAVMADRNCPSCRQPVDTSPEDLPKTSVGTARISRPTSITIISWILMVTSIIGLISSTVHLKNPLMLELMAKSPIPIPIQFAIQYFALTLIFVCGVAMLDGHNWGRWLYVGWCVTSFTIGVAMSPMKLLMIPSLLVFLIIAFFLFRPQATRYFCRSGGSDE